MNMQPANNPGFSTSANWCGERQVLQRGKGLKIQRPWQTAAYLCLHAVAPLLSSSLALKLRVVHDGGARRGQNRCQSSMETLL